MKRFIVFIFSILIGYTLFAENKVTVMPVKTPYNEIQVTEDNKNQQTVISDSGIEITVDAEIIDNDLQYNIKLTNLKNKDFKVCQDCIKTYYGNFDKDDWTQNDYTTYKLPASKNETNTSNKDSNEEMLENCIVMGATCLCALTLITICDSSSKSNSVKSSKSSNVRKVEPRNSKSSSSKSKSKSSSTNNNFIWLFIDTPSHSKPSNNSNNKSDSNSTSLSITFSADVSVNENIDNQEEDTINDVYKGSFLVPAGNGPDYKLRFIVSENEFIDFYFSRSDRDNIVNPFKDRTYARHSLLAGCGFYDELNYGGYYIYSGTSLGFYIGGLFDINFTGDEIGTYKGDPNDVVPADETPKPNGYLNNYTYNYSLHDIDNVLYNIYTIDLGLTFKIIPNTWLMLGCGIKYSVMYVNGNLYYKYDFEDDTAYSNPVRYLDTGYVKNEEKDISFYPEVGLNFIFDHLDLGLLCQYSINDNNFKFVVLAGLAF